VERGREGVGDGPAEHGGDGHGYSSPFAFALALSCWNSS
jgi:hypothetical protein